MSKGKVYEVRHPKLALVGRSTVFIGTPAADLPYPTYDDYVTVALMHIKQIEPLQSTQAAP